ncbi:sporulation protein [Longispora sp. NPDC051575]|uniref:sporulation protein n=1 Tax=Longispora sp. NPDC051575 TaxID=3154943 RepID=UPI00343536B2
MVFKKMLSKLGVGAPTVDTVLTNPNTRPGLSLDGHVNIVGGTVDADIEHVTLSLVTRVDRGDHSGTVEFHRLPVTGRFTLKAGEKQSIPFQLPVPWETPITHVHGGQRLHGMVMGVRTELAIAGAIDKGDLDDMSVHPLPAHEAILDAFGQLGFRFKKADLEAGRIRGTQQTLPFYQEIEYYAGPAYAHALNEVEVTFITSTAGVDVVVEVDKRGGLFSGGHDVYFNLHVPHSDSGTDWAAHIDSWLQSKILSHVPAHGAYGHSGHGYRHGGHGSHGHGHRGGMGAGAVVGGVAAGLVGGYVAGEIMDDMFDGGDEDF